MRIFLAIVLLTAILLTADIASAQFKESEPVKPSTEMFQARPVTTFNSLIDPSRISMHHMYSFTYFTGSGKDGTLGIYTNTMNYRLSDPLSLNINLGLAHQPFGPEHGMIGTDKAKFMHGAELVYKPNSKFQLNVGYNNTPHFGGLNMFNRFSRDNDFDPEAN